MERENRLGEFLRARRRLLRPEDVGAVAGGIGRRRVIGLRREEVAQLAGMSTDYYTRLEQGRERHPSRQLLDAVARALQLDEVSTAHLVHLAEPAPGLAPRARTVSPQLLRLMAGWTDNPAFVLGHAMDLLALNPLARAVYSGFRRPDNLLRMVLLDPHARSFYAQHDAVVRGVIGSLRAAAGDAPGDPRIRELVGELTVKSPDFAELWERHEVYVKSSHDKHYRHGDVGDLFMTSQTFTVNGAPGQQLVVYQAEPASPTAQALALLGTLAATHPDMQPTTG